MHTRWACFPSTMIVSIGSMARQEQIDQNALESEPSEFRIILRRNVDASLSPEEVGSFLQNNDDNDDIEPTDIFWEGEVSDLASANLWELANLVPTLESDWYELQLKLGEGDYELVSTFRTEEDYEQVIIDATSEHPELVPLDKPES